MSSNSRYEPLGEYLDKLPASENEVSLTFAQIEEIVEGVLPPSARKYNAWWANDETHPIARQWLNAGWHRSALDLADEAVTFSRDE